MDEGLVVKAYTVTVDGYTAVRYVAKSAGKARAAAWRDFQIVGPCSFKDFMRRASVRSASPGATFGTPITVGGEPAFQVGYDGHYVQFVRPDSDVVLNSHPNDVSPR